MLYYLREKWENQQRESLKGRERSIQEGAKVDLQLRVHKTQFVLVLLFIIILFICITTVNLHVPVPVYRPKEG